MPEPVLNVVMKRVGHVASGLKLSAEKPPGTMIDLKLLWLSHGCRVEFAGIFAHSNMKF